MLIEQESVPTNKEISLAIEIFRIYIILKLIILKQVLKAIKLLKL